VLASIDTVRLGDTENNIYNMKRKKNFCYKHALRDIYVQTFDP